MNIIYQTLNKAQNQLHFYSGDGVLLGFSDHYKNYALDGVSVYGQKKPKTIISVEELLKLARIDYQQFSEVDLMQGYLISGLPELPVMPSEDMV